MVNRIGSWGAMECMWELNELWSLLGGRGRAGGGDGGKGPRWGQKTKGSAMRKTTRLKTEPPSSRATGRKALTWTPNLTEKSTKSRNFSLNDNYR